MDVIGSVAWVPRVVGDGRLSYLALSRSAPVWVTKWTIPDAWAEIVRDHWQ